MNPSVEQLIRLSYKNRERNLYMKKSIEILLPLIFLTVCLLLTFQEDLRLAVPLLIGVTAFLAVLLALIAHYEVPNINLKPVTIIVVALLLRLMFLLQPPQLSDDIYRYLWDGTELLKGINPYAYAPSRVTPPVEMQKIHAQINHPKYVTIYPPAAQLVFAAGATLGGTVTGLKTLLIAIDLFLCWLLMMVLKHLEMPVWHAVLYAWNPLPVIEIASSGHVDGAGLAMLTGALLLLLPKRDCCPTPVKNIMSIMLSGALLAGAVLVKLLPLILFPIFFILVPRDRRLLFISTFIATLAALALPFIPDLPNMLTSLKVYAYNWEFAGFAFSTIRTLTGSGSLARMIVLGTFLIIAIAVLVRLRRSLQNSPETVERNRIIISACYATVMAFLLLTPTLQPWYALFLAVFLPYCAGPAGMILCWAVFLTYQVQIDYFILGKWLENPLVSAAVFLAPVTAGILALLCKRQCCKGESLDL